MKYLLENEETARITFRKVDENDFPVWLDFFRNPRSFAHWKQEPEEAEIQCKKWYEKQLNRYASDRGGMNALIEKTTGKLIGHCGLLIQTVDSNSEMEIGYSLLPQFWNKGFATEAAIRCRDHAFEHKLRDSLISIVSITNAPSANVATKNSMKPEKQTVYNENEVTIFRIRSEDWAALR